MPPLTNAQTEKITPPPPVCPGDRDVHYGVDGQEGSTFLWEIDGGEFTSQIENGGSSQVTVNWFDYADDYKLRVTEFTNIGCKGPTKSEYINMYPVPEVNIPDADICEGQIHTFEVSDDPAIIDQYWQDGTRSRFFNAMDEGMYWVQVVDTTGCQNVDSAYLAVHPLPDVDLGKDFTLDTKDTLIDAGNFTGDYEWFSNNGPLDQNSPQFKVDADAPDTLWVIVTDQYGCQGRDTVVIEKKIDKVKVASLITPNNDGKNDKWVIEGIDQFPDATIEVFDRWGNTVYSAKAGEYEPWDGRVNGKPLPMDSYHYIIELGGDMPPKKGIITIVPYKKMK